MDENVHGKEVFRSAISQGHSSGNDHQHEILGINFRICHHRPAMRAESFII